MNCKQATELMSQSQDRHLSRREQLSLRIHLLICKGCNRYNQQLDMIREAMKRFIDRRP